MSRWKSKQSMSRAVATIKHRSKRSPPPPPDASLLYADPFAWGSSAWMFLHCISMTYPKRPTASQKKQYETFFLSLKAVLPCKKCRLEYASWLKSHPVHHVLTSRNRLVQWVIDLHNCVNRRNGKPEYTKEQALSVLEKKARLEQQRRPDWKTTSCPFAKKK